jgi:hypothetical protein
MRAQDFLFETEYHVTFVYRGIKREFTVSASSEKDAVGIAKDQLTNELPSNQKDTADRYNLANISIDADPVIRENPTITPKSSEFVQTPHTPPADGQETPDTPKNMASNTPSPVANPNAPPSAKDKMIGAIAQNHNKNMIDRTTAINQLKGQGVSDQDISKYIKQ